MTDFCNCCYITTTVAAVILVGLSIRLYQQANATQRSEAKEAARKKRSILEDAIVGKGSTIVYIRNDSKRYTVDVQFLTQTRLAKDTWLEKIAPGETKSERFTHADIGEWDPTYNMWALMSVWQFQMPRNASGFLGKFVGHQKLNIPPYGVDFKHWYRIEDVPGKHEVRILGGLK